MIAAGVQVWSSRKAVAQSEKDAVRKVLEALKTAPPLELPGQIPTLSDRRELLDALLFIDTSMCPEDFRETWFNLIEAARQLLNPHDNGQGLQASEVQFRKLLDDLGAKARQYGAE